MARGLKYWFGGIILACGVVAVANLPFRGTRESKRATLFLSRLPQLTPARQRAQAAADQWRTAQTASRLAEERMRLRARLALANQGSDRPLLIMVGVDPDSAALRARIAAQLDSAWLDLGLAETKINVGVVFDPIEGADTSLPREESWGPSYLLPDSTNRTICLVRLQENAGWRRAILRESTHPWLRRWLQSTLGPCAFLAAYGMPGRSVRNWLDSYGFDLAIAPSWNDSVTADGRRASSLMPRDGKGWWWDYVYHQSFPAVACLAGRIAGCREAVLGAPADARSRQNVVMTNRRFWQRQRLINGAFYLSDVARAVGRDRFLEFWNSSLPVDTALARALRQPVGEWTAAWQRRSVPELRLGPSAPWGSSFLAALLAGAAIATVTLTVRKRQIR